MMRLISMANLIKKTLQDKYLSDLFGKCIKRNKSRHHDASYFLLTLLYY